MPEEGGDTFKGQKRSEFTNARGKELWVMVDGK
jgi:hypothetical protein